MMDNITMTDRKPYLLRAIYQWIVDNDCTPHLVIAAPGAGWVHGVPSHLLQEEMLVLNISPQAPPTCKSKTTTLPSTPASAASHTKSGWRWKPSLRWLRGKMAKVSACL